MDTNQPSKDSYPLLLVLKRYTPPKITTKTHRLLTATYTPAIMRFLKSRDKGTVPKTSSAPEQEDKPIKPKYEFDFEDQRREKEKDPDDPQKEGDIDTNLLLARLRSRATKQYEGEPTTRCENEDPKANELFHDVPGYKENLRPDGQKKRTTPDAYPSDNLMRGPVRPTRRVEGDDPAADQLLAGASERQKPSQLEEATVHVPTVHVPTVHVPTVNKESRMINIAREVRGLGFSVKTREKGEDPAADALFKTSARP